MSMSIYKYPLKIEEGQTITLPRSTRVLTVQTQNGFPCIWAMIDTDPLVDEEFVTFYVYGTGQTIPDKRVKDTYVGTFQMDDGALVFHVFHD